MGGGEIGIDHQLRIQRLDNTRGRQHRGLTVVSERGRGRRGDDRGRREEGSAEGRPRRRHREHREEEEERQGLVREEYSDPT